MGGSLAVWVGSAAVLRVRGFVGGVGFVAFCCVCLI